MASRSCPVCVLRSLAQRTFDDLTDAHNLHISLGEETITDRNVLDIRRAGIPGLSVWKANKNEERRLGIDLEMWTGSSRAGWLRYAIQAKKLAQKSKRYESIRHLVDKGPPKKRQIDILESYVGTPGVNAIGCYCLYNGGVDWDNRLALPSLQIDEYGCTLAPLTLVRQIHDQRGGRTFPSIHHDNPVYPWHIFVKHHCDVVETCMGRSTAWGSASFSDFTGREAAGLVWSELPDEVHRLLNGEPSSFDSKIYPDPEIRPKRILVADLSEIQRRPE